VLLDQKILCCSKTQDTFSNSMVNILSFEACQCHQIQVESIAP